MGSQVSQICCSDDRDEKERDKFLKNSYEKFYCIIDDYEYFYNRENWMDSLPNPLYDPDKLLLAYNDYKYHQVINNNSLTYFFIRKKWINHGKKLIYLI